MIAYTNTYIKSESTEWYETLSPQGIADTKIIESTIDEFLDASLGESRTKNVDGNTATAVVLLAGWDRETAWYSYAESKPDFMSSQLNLHTYNANNGIDDQFVSNTLP